MKKLVFLLIGAGVFLSSGAFAQTAPKPKPQPKAQPKVQPKAQPANAQPQAAVQPVRAMAPDELVKTVADEVLDIIRKDNDIKAGNTQRVVELIEQKVLPHFDFSRMAALAVGKDWRQATPEQQQTLTAEFRDLLVRTYSNALAAYKDETIDFRPFKMQPDETDVVVRTQINQPGARQPIKLDYSLEKSGNVWKVYDVTVADVSLVTSYRSSFATEIRNGGIDGLIKALQSKNSSTARK
ncbi:MAG: ABC transporter substrate-binding protein [Zoogloeaceae bacterium]|jgi:phospholipid transport system substrate-binding protein|nr:ABC transporter substrate-binding protein [Zoogloeaceae bacterium]